MKKINLIKKKFEENGYVKIDKILKSSEVNKILDEINNIKNKFLNIKNPNLHLTKDKKINTIHDINKFVHCLKIVIVSFLAIHFLFSMKKM